jgi:ubiquitin carboxyl-terminal hydrolase 7
MSYDKLSEKVGERLGVQPTHLRFYTVNASSNNPRTAVKRGQNQTLGSILMPAGYGQLNMNQRNDALFFEVLDMSLAELDTKKSIKLTLLSEGITKEVGGTSMYRLDSTDPYAGPIRRSGSQKRPGGRSH